MAHEQTETQQPSIDEKPSVSDRDFAVSQQVTKIEPQMVRRKCDPEIYTNLPCQQDLIHKIQQIPSDSLRATPYSSVAAVYRVTRTSKKRVSFSVELATIRTYNVQDGDVTDDDQSTVFQSPEIYRY